MMIEDKELRDLFRGESAEHLQKIEAGLLRLEQNPEDAALLGEVFREAHSLKGAARMLGLRDIQGLAHEIENLLGEARQCKVRISSAVVVPQLALLDRIRERVAVVLGDAPSQPRLPAAGATPVAAADISGVTPPVPTLDPSVGSGVDWAGTGAAVVQPPSSHPRTRTTSPDQRVSPSPLSATDAGRGAVMPPTVGGAAVPDLRIETLRVESTQLDDLMQLGGELIVCKGRLSRGEVQLDQLLTQCEHHLKRPRGDARQVLAEVTAELARVRAGLASDLARLDAVAVEIENDIHGLRLLPMATLLDLFPRMVYDLARELGKQVLYQVDGAAAVADKRIIEELKAPLTHLLRNAIDHGIESPLERRGVGKSEQGLLRISVTRATDALHIEVSDDGRGLSMEALRRRALELRLQTAEELEHLSPDQLNALILRPGFSTARMITDLSGRGVGLDVVRATIERLHGAIQVESVAGQGLRIRLRLPVSLTATRALLVHEWGQTYALPLEEIRFVKRLRQTDVQLIEGRQCFYQEGQAIAIERLGLLLERAPPAFDEGVVLEVAVVQVGNERFGLVVERVLEITDLVVKPLMKPLKRVRHLAGLAVLGSGAVCPVLHAYDLLRSMSRTRQRSAVAPAEKVERPARKRILLAEDSITTRVQERRILEAAGYEVQTAVDGLDAWSKLSLQTFDAVVSDIQMPRMSGLELAERIRQSRQYAELPIVLVTSLASESDRRRGLEVGADAYISKSEFDQGMLLDCLARLA